MKTPPADTTVVLALVTTVLALGGMPALSATVVLLAWLRWSY